MKQIFQLLEESMPGKRYSYAFRRQAAEGVLVR
jgi:hypothetical protein